MMTYAEALEYVHSVCWRGSRPGLSRITELMDRLGNPQEHLRCIHVAGTNGKGSVCAMLASVLQASGYRVGLFTSPFIRHFNERIQVGGRPVPEERFAQVTERVRPAAEAMDDPPTEFELITAIGFLCFAEEACDYIVLEAGMGGRLDSTNIVSSPLVSVITGVALDHTAFLGDTLEKIAFEKAGILKRGCPAVFGGGAPEAESVVIAAAREKAAPMTVVDRRRLRNIRHDLCGSRFDFFPWQELSIPLLGVYQPDNAATVLTVVETLRAGGIEIPDPAVRTGLSLVVWPARFEKLCDNPVVIFDGGHNEQGIDACVESVRQYFPGQDVVILTGVMRDKAYPSMAEKIGKVARMVYTVTPGNPRALDAKVYAGVFQKNGIPAQAFPSVEEGLQAAYRTAADSGCPLIILGSLYFYADVRGVLDHLLDKAL